ncbi:hypothetical protein C8Q76DRAFT_257981 [Earliella scabrosa]|nr:hypothetical protein C8Q76DRAFT_257981 [Earliella scabrosa]
MSIDEQAARSTLTSSLVALFVESLLFGVFAVLYAICTWLLVFRDTRGARGRCLRDIVLFVASTLMFVLTLIHVALDVHIVLRAFVANGGDLRKMSSTIEVFNGLSNAAGAAKFGIYVTQVLLGDGFMIYRAFIVWDRRPRVTVSPLILLTVEVLLGYYITFAGTASPANRPEASTLTALVNAFFLLSVATNLISTGLIMVPILRSDYEVQGYLADHSQGRSVKWRVFESILQSAAIYSIASISLAITSFVSPTVGFPACHSVFPSVIVSAACLPSSPPNDGIVFLLIVARICSHTTASDLPRHSIVQLNRETMASCPNIPVVVQERDIEPTSPSSLRSLPIAIHVSVSTTSDRESAFSYERASQSSLSKLLEAVDASPLPQSASPESRPMSPKVWSLDEEMR